MTISSLEFLSFFPLSGDSICSVSEKQKIQKKINEDPRMKDFVKKIVSIQSNGNIALATGNWETEEEYQERREKILKHKF